MAEDTSVPTLSNYFRLLVVPQRLQHLFRKRYQTTSRASEKSLGNLKGFVDLPVDIALEIARYLRPSDLLELSRLSKQFRSIFASRSALFIWRAAFRDREIKCPSYLSELQLTSFIHDDCCMSCGRTVRCDLFHLLYLRLCKSCQTVNLISIHDLMIRHRSSKAHELIVSMPNSKLQCFRPEAELLLQKLFSLKTENVCRYIAKVKAYSRARSIEQEKVLYICETGKWHTILSSLPF